MGYRNTPLFPSSAQGTLANDTQLLQSDDQDHQDTISCLSWSPTAENLLATASWDGKLRIYDVGSGAKSVVVPATVNPSSPILSCDWTLDGTALLIGSADNNIYMTTPTTNTNPQTTIIGSHTAAIRSVRNISPNVIVTGSYDKTVKYWDIRQQTYAAATTLTCLERVYSLDTNARFSSTEDDRKLVIATAQGNIHLVDLRYPGIFLDTRSTSLHHQITAIRSFPDGKGFVVGGVEGRCVVVDESKGMNRLAREKNEFSFKCHRTLPETNNNNTNKTRTTSTTTTTTTTKIYPVNDIRFHPIHHATMVTAGSDGTFIFWDAASRQKKKSYPTVPYKYKYKYNNANQENDSPPPLSITALAFNSDGKKLAYAVGYDWNRGHAGNSPELERETRVMIHPVLDDEVMPPRYDGRRY
ncbi:Poly(A)+ RNA export protein [Poronia punctata]|nr:Poly(A)+ RNA export protein [Poronia punctata]